MTTVSTGTGFVLWFTDLAGRAVAGIAGAVEAGLRERGHDVETLDYGEAREQLGQGLGYSRTDRDTVAVRLGWVAGRLAVHGVAVLVPVIASPHALERVRDSIPNFVEIVVDGAGELEVSAQWVLATLELRGLIGRDEDDVYSSAEEDAVAAHLRDLGYVE
jgi:adenylylsulfate kinase